MKNEHHYAHVWLSRMWGAEAEIKALEYRKDRIIASLSGIGKYDDKAIPGGSDPNPTESKNIEYTLICEQIDKKLNEISAENIRTMAVLDKVEDTMLRGMLKARYINVMTWTQVGKLYNYEHSRIFDYRLKALDAVYPFIPKEVIEDEQI